MNIFILDSMVFDKIIENEAVKTLIIELREKQKVRLLTSSVQDFQHKNTPDSKADKREKLVDLANQICERVSAGNFPIRIGKIGIDKIGEIGLIREITEEERTGLKNMSGNKWKDLLDESIALIARDYQGFLVTVEDTLRNRAEKVGIQTLSFEQFVEKLKSYD